jgi:farnesyl diphosphate synthase
MTKDFVDVFSVISRNVVEEMKSLGFPDQAVDYMNQMLSYNVVGGKMNRGLSVGHSYSLVKGRELSVEEKLEADILGWCVEILQAFFLVADDLMDHSKTRRGQPCWYLLPQIGNNAVNDSFILESVIYKTLKTYFREKPYYVGLLEQFHSVTYQTELGQLMDLITAPIGKINFDNFNIHRYNLIVEYKTAYYSFYLPVVLGLLMAGIDDEKAFKICKDILIPLGSFFQVQDDYLDCFGDPKTIGKIGTDIQDNKCSWLVVQALSMANDADLEVLRQNYGKDDQVCVDRVKDVYRKLDLPGVFKQFEDESYKNIMNLINDSSSAGIPPAVFIDFAKRIYKRKY